MKLYDYNSITRKIEQYENGRFIDSTEIKEGWEVVTGNYSSATDEITLETRPCTMKDWCEVEWRGYQYEHILESDTLGDVKVLRTEQRGYLQDGSYIRRYVK